MNSKYRRGTNALDGVDTALLATNMGSLVGSVGLLSTVIAAPAVLGSKLRLCIGKHGVANLVAENCKQERQASITEKAWRSCEERRLLRCMFALDTAFT